jgi:hypothetical protein
MNAKKNSKSTTITITRRFAQVICFYPRTDRHGPSADGLLNKVALAAAILQLC